MKRHLPLPDVLKGLAIFLVVMGHVLTMCIRDIDRASLFKFIGQTHMPLFFFVSGLLTLRRQPDGSVRLPNLWQRAVRLLLPMVAVSTLWIYWFPNSGLQSPLEPGWAGLWGSLWKNGYWFTPVLFEITILYVPFALLLGHVRRPGSQIALAVAFCVVISVAVSFLPPRWAEISSLPLAAMFLPPFLAGVIAGDRLDAFLLWCRRSGVVTVSLLATAVLMSYVCWYWRYPLIPAWAVTVAQPLLHISLAVLAVGVLGAWADGGTPAVRLWSFLGRKSLAIYLLHYFFLFPMGWIRPWLESMDLAIVPLGAVCALVAALIIGAVLLVDFVVCHSRPLALLLTGTKV